MGLHEEKNRKKKEKNQETKNIKKFGILKQSIFMLKKKKRNSST
jgi:hypothetical protein